MDKIIRFILKVKENKLNFIFLISTFIVALYDLFLLIFDLVQIIVASNNGAMLASSFMTINIIGIVLNCANLCFFAVIIALKFRNVKSR